MESYELTPEQQKAVKSLRRAFKRCEDAGLHLWDDDGTIRAVNGQVVDMVSPEVNPGSEWETLDREQVDEVYSEFGCWHGSNADDPLMVHFRGNKE